MLPMARMTERTIGVCTGHEHPIVVGGQVMTSQSTVLVNGLPAARAGDIVISDCGHTGVIVGGTPDVLIVGLPAAKMNESFVGTYTGNIIAGSGNVMCR